MNEEPLTTDEETEKDENFSSTGISFAEILPIIFLGAFVLPPLIFGILSFPPEGVYETIGFISYIFVMISGVMILVFIDFLEDFSSRHRQLISIFIVPPVLAALPASAYMIFGWICIASL